MWLHRSARTCTAPSTRMATTGTSPSIAHTGLPSAGRPRPSDAASRARPGAGPARRGWPRRPAGTRCDRPASPLADTAASPASRSAVPRAGRGPGHRGAVQGGGGEVGGRVHYADAHLLLMLLGPVGRARQRGGDRRGQPGSAQPPGRLLVVARRPRMLADGQAPAEAWSSTGMQQVPPHTPCSPSRTWPGRIRRAARWPVETAPSRREFCSRAGMGCMPRLAFRGRRGQTQGGPCVCPARRREQG